MWSKSLSLTHGTHLANTEATRRIWETDEAWQPAREALERLLLAYDILLSYAADGGTIAKRSTQQEGRANEGNHTHARVESGAGARLVTRDAA